MEYELKKFRIIRDILLLIIIIILAIGINIQNDRLSDISYEKENIEFSGNLCRDLLSDTADDFVSLRDYTYNMTGSWEFYNNWVKNNE